MTQRLQRALPPLLLPALVLASALFLDSRHDFASDPRFRWLAWAPFALLAAGAGLAWRFRRTRMVYALAALAALFWASAEGLAAPEVVAVLIPLNLVVFAQGLDPALLSLPGVSRLAFFGAQGFLVWWFAHPEGQPHLDQLSRPLVEGWGWLTPAPFACMVAGAALAGALLLSPGHVEAAFTGMWGATTAATLGAVGQPTLLFCAAGAMAMLAVVQHSYGLAYLDELTELPGRRALNEELARLGGTYTVAMVDVDHFKQFNDTHGHDVGDQVLRLVASRLRKVEGGGRAYRYGGEEFTLLFPGRPVDEALDYLEAVRQEIERTPMVLRSPDRPRKKPKSPPRTRGPRKTVSVTVSIGAAERGRKLRKPEQILKAADEALYRAKKSGRNQVCA